MVVNTDHSTADIPRSTHRYWRKLRCSTLYLYPILKNIVQAQDRFKTILVIVTGLIALAWIFDAPLLGKIALAIGALSVFIPAAARAIEWTWLKIALILGWVNSRILLSIVYFLFLMPIAWLARLFLKDPLALKKDKRDTLFATRNHLYTGKDLENIW